MTPAQTILQMIEAVDPADTDKLDKIDARVWCWLEGAEYVGPRWQGGFEFTGWDTDEDTVDWVTEDCVIQYTRSRDALKSIRPEDWTPIGYHSFGRYINRKDETFWAFNLCKSRHKLDERPPVFTAEAPTEELAELHAIIQATQYEREKADD